MGYNFSPSSLQKLNQCDKRLQDIANEAIKIFNFTIDQGYMDEAFTELMFKQGKSEVHWPNSKHNANPSLAMDIVPYWDGKIVWNDIKKWHFLLGIIWAIASEKGTQIRLGADWNRNFDFINSQNRFPDLGHVEIHE